MQEQNIGKKIKSLRRDQGLTQAELASRIHVTPQNISQYERGIRTPKTATKQKIAGALGVPVASLDSDFSAPFKMQLNLFQEHVSPEALDIDIEQVIKYIKRLNDRGRLIAIERVEELTKISEYTRKEDSTEV